MCLLNSAIGSSMNQCTPLPAGCAGPSERCIARAKMSAQFLFTP